MAPDVGQVAICRSRYVFYFSSLLESIPTRAEGDACVEIEEVSGDVHGRGSGRGYFLKWLLS